MPIAYDNATAQSELQGTTLTYSHTTGAGSNRALIVYAYTNNNSDIVTGVTYGGVAMTLIDKVINIASAGCIYAYFLANPASGTNNVVCSQSNSSNYMSAVAISYTGVKQTDNPEVYTDVNTTSSGSTLSLTTTTADCWLLLMQRGCWTSVTSSLTQRGYSSCGYIWDSNAGVGAGSNSAGFSSGATNSHGTILFALAPALEVSTFIPKIIMF